MCGRFSIVDGTRKVEHRFGAKYTEAQFETFYSAHYNAAPSMILPIVTTPFPGSAEKELVLARWGFQWPQRAAKEFKRPPQANARIETVAEKPMFASAYMNRHCLIPANSFFEWLRSSKFSQPYRILLKDESLFAMAGIWNDPISPADPPTFAVLTTSANELMSRIHDRMPVILRKDQEDLWLREVGNSTLNSRIHTQFPSEEMKMYPVSQKMNKVSFDSAEAIAPIAEPSLGL